MIYLITLKYLITFLYLYILRCLDILFNYLSVPWYTYLNTFILIFHINFHINFSLIFIFINLLLSIYLSIHYYLSIYKTIFHINVFLSIFFYQFHFISRSIPFLFWSIHTQIVHTKDLRRLWWFLITSPSTSNFCQIPVNRRYNQRKFKCYCKTRNPESILKKEMDKT